MNSENPVKSVGLLTTDIIFTSRTAVYAIRMYGAVGGALSDGRPYPYMPSRRNISMLYLHQPQNFMDVKG